MLNDLKVIPLLCNLIAFEKARTIKEEGLLVAVACMLGGNEMTQMEFFRYITKDT